MIKRLDTFSIFYRPYLGSIIRFYSNNKFTIRTESSYTYIVFVFKYFHTFNIIN